VDGGAAGETGQHAFELVEPAVPGGRAAGGGGEQQLDEHAGAG
jgi:hypothetical protein